MPNIENDRVAHFANTLCDAATAYARGHETAWLEIAQSALTWLRQHAAQQAPLSAPAEFSADPLWQTTPGMFLPANEMAQKIADELAYDALRTTFADPAQAAQHAHRAPARQAQTTDAEGKLYQPDTKRRTRIERMAMKSHRETRPTGYYAVVEPGLCDPDDLRDAKTLRDALNNLADGDSLYLSGKQARLVDRSAVHWKPRHADAIVPPVGPDVVIETLKKGGV